MPQWFSVGTVTAETFSEDGGNEPMIVGNDGDRLDLADYSRFKYGDGSMAGQYGRRMAMLLLDAQPELLEQPVVHVASSAFKAAPPAAHALLRPFLDQSRRQASDSGSATRFVPFKVHRETLTNGDYAGMDLEARKRAMDESDLWLPDGLDLEGGTVVMLDDIRVTGSHEQAVDRVLGPAALDGLYHGYVLSVDGGSRHPKLEAAINSIGIKTMEDIVELSRAPDFTPNARLCKFILSQPMEGIAKFCREAPWDVVATVGCYMKGDELHLMEKYTGGYDDFAGATQSGPMDPYGTRRSHTGDLAHAGFTPPPGAPGTLSNATGRGPM